MHQNAKICQYIYILQILKLKTLDLHGWHSDKQIEKIKEQWELYKLYIFINYSMCLYGLCAYVCMYAYVQ